MNALFIHAHFDDFEFTAAGTFALLRRKFGHQFRGKIIICTDGAAGHHSRSREETATIRLAEQKASAKLGALEFELLKLPDGSTLREGAIEVNRNFLSALWNSIRHFEPDYLFCPPIPADPLAGIHVDHLAVAEAVRKVAYFLNVPHAYTREYPKADQSWKKTPVILNVFDPYAFGDNKPDLAINVKQEFELVARMTFCHQSQIMEWLPWIGRHKSAAPKNFKNWRTILRKRFARVAKDAGINPGLFEFFTVTAWGEVPDYKQLLKDFSGVDKSASNLSKLQRRLAGWNSI